MYRCYVQIDQYHTLFNNKKDVQVVVKNETEVLDRVNFDMSDSKSEDSEGLAKETIKRYEESKEQQATKTSDNNGEIEIIENFFKKYEDEVFNYYKEKKEEYKSLGYELFKEKYSKYGSELSKTDISLIQQTHLEPKAGCGLSIKEIVARDIEVKKVKLYKNIENKAGKVVEVNLYADMSGVINGTIKGAIATVTIDTIVAGGHSVQCLHYRTLVKVTK